MDLSGEALIDIEDGLMASVLDSGLWPDTVSKIVRATDSKGAAILPLRGRVPGIPMSASVEPMFDDYFREGWSERDFRMSGLPKAMRTGMLVDQDICDADFMRTHPFYADVLARHGLMWFAGLVVNLGDDVWGFTLQRGPEHGPFDAAQQAELHRLLAVLKRLGRFVESVGKARLQGVAATLDTLQSPTILLDRTGRVLHLSEKAAALVPRLLDISRGYVSVRGDPEATRRLNAHLRSAIWRRETASHPSQEPVLVARPEGRPLLLHAQALRKSGLDYFDGARIMLTVTSPTAPRELRGPVLRELYDLTPRELGVCASLHAGKSLRECAADLGIDYETVRTHVKAVFVKTGTGGQAELTSLLCRLSA